MTQHRVRLMHRIAVDWVADTFGLRTPDARTRHENARFQAGARAAAVHARARARAQAGARVLQGWQARIGRAAGQDRGAA